ncbi:uncharacterized protein METZ01_LOCUS103498 [marine metagenome]|uniref:ABC transporter domain-containing protein n=1 Tax=marine metagenome TaxID=408172 RepID=A0A381WDV6_9ZZZZ
MSKPLLQVEALRVEFNTRDGVARVIDDLDISLNSGEILGIVGESGCGKSMTALSIMGLVPTPPGRIASGTIRLAGENLVQASEQRLRQVRGNEISMIFQEPMTSLNPVFSIGDQIAETVMLHENRRKQDAWDWAVEMLEAVGIPDAEQRAYEYPHQMSGGMRQRVMIAMALACQPKVLIADEPTTALDVTVQAQIFDLLKELRERTGAAIILITHDMGAIAEMTERVVVMYAGRKVEDGPVDEILAAPRHPYTLGLIACVPHLSLEIASERPLLVEIPGIVPSLTQIGKGCPFAPRCNQVMDKCLQDMPPRLEVSTQHSVACWRVEQEGVVA